MQANSQAHTVQRGTTPASPPTSSEQQLWEPGHLLPSIIPWAAGVRCTHSSLYFNVKAVSRVDGGSVHITSQMETEAEGG